MTIDISALIPIADTGHDLSKVVRLVDEQGPVVIMENDRPRYAVIDLSGYDVFQQYRR